MEKGWGVPMFAYLAQHPEDASLFSEMMVAIHGAEPPAIAAAYNFTDFGAVVDVGGATGNMLAAILARYPGPRGILFDRPHVVSDAPEIAQSAWRGGDSVTIEPGDFFETVPCWWRCLHSVAHHPRLERRTMPCHPGQLSQRYEAEARLLIVEMVLPDGDTPHRGKLLDMAMLAITRRSKSARRPNIQTFFAQSGLPSQLRGAYGVRCKRGGSRAGLADVTTLPGWTPTRNSLRRSRDNPALRSMRPFCISMT